MTYRPTGPALSVGPTAIQYKIVVLIFKVHSISTPVYLSDGYRGGREGGMAPPPLETQVPTLPLQKSVEFKAGKCGLKIPSF